MKTKLKAVEAKAKTCARPGTLFDPSFVFTKGADVMRTWKRYGFVPPSEYRNDYQFKVNREGVTQ